MANRHSFFFCSLLLFSCCVACNSAEKDAGRTSTMDAILDGTFATDKAMQEERTEQDNYIKEQQERYE